MAAFYSIRIPASLPTKEPLPSPEAQQESQAAGLALAGQLLSYLSLPCPGPPTRELVLTTVDRGLLH